VRTRNITFRDINRCIERLKLYTLVESIANRWVPKHYNMWNGQKVVIRTLSTTSYFLFILQASS